MLPVQNLIKENVQIGLLTLNDLDLRMIHPELEKRLSTLLEQRKKPLSNGEDLFRKACRDMMRIGSYKPTGRSKPASEYLLRTASEGTFPRINTIVDINNYISLKYLVPISLWDTDKIEADSWLFRTGSEDEYFVFNTSGQIISLKDLVAGFAVLNNRETPIVTPVKDSQLTKSDNETRNLVAAVYYPAQWESQPSLREILDEFAELLDVIANVRSINRK